VLPSCVPASRHEALRGTTNACVGTARPMFPMVEDQNASVPSPAERRTSGRSGPEHKTYAADLDNPRLPVYTALMGRSGQKPFATPCMCNALRQTSRAVSRLYDEEFRKVGLRTTQFSLLWRVRRLGEVRQRDLGKALSLEETTLTRNLRPLIDSGWMEVSPGDDRREKLIRLTKAGKSMLRKAKPAWERAQERARSRFPKGTWGSLLKLLPEITHLVESA
jgi:DNA-binding MarR family transcriptional regulator